MTSEEAASETFEENNKSISYYFAYSQKRRKLFGNKIAQK